MLHSLGKIRGLQTAANMAGVFTILALDHGASFLKTINPKAPEMVTFDQAVATKTTLLQILAPHASAVLLDPIYGLWPAITGSALPGNVGLLVAIEDGDYADPIDRHGRLLAGWSVAQIKRIGAAAVKLFFYYHPEAGEAAQAQEALVAEVVDDCRRYDIPLFAEPLSYNVGSTDRRQVVVETARCISRLGVDVLKVEFPVDVTVEQDQSVWLAACRELSAACGRVPWVLLSAGVDFETFARQVRIACQAGASGYLAGRAIWQEAVQLTDRAQQIFLAETVVPRLQTLTEITRVHARPWTDFYPDLSDRLSPNWYKKYKGFS
jgi:tagatose 1,6-diphosphate aldolase